MAIIELNKIKLNEVLNLVFQILKNWVSSLAQFLTERIRLKFCLEFV
jgi:hypothetical protein